jgi:hypothetical protein
MDRIMKVEGMECERCKATTVKLDRCGKCKVVAYCSRAHQAADWKNHKITCRAPDDLIAGDIVELFGLSQLDNSELSNGMNFEVRRKMGVNVFLSALGNFKEFNLDIKNMRRVLIKENRP